MSTPPSAVGWRDDEQFSYITRAVAPITLLFDVRHNAMRHDSRAGLTFGSHVDARHESGSPRCRMRVFEIATSRAFV